MASESKGAPAPKLLDELRAARTSWHEEFGVPISLRYARFLTAIGMLEDYVAAHCQAPAPADQERDLYALLRGICEDVIDWMGTLSYDQIGGKEILDHPLTKEIRLKLQRMYDHPLDDKLLGRTDQLETLLTAATPQGTSPSDPIRLLLIRAITEMSYMHCAEVLSLVRSAEGEAIIEEGMKLIGLKDLSEEELARVRNGEVGNGKR